MYYENLINPLCRKVTTVFNLMLALSMSILGSLWYNCKITSPVNATTVIGANLCSKLHRFRITKNFLQL
jgi:hypothetical protein